MPLFATSWLDPTFLFGLNCLFSVVFLKGTPNYDDPGASTLTLRAFSTIPQVLLDYLTDPAFFIAAVVLLIGRHFVGDKPRKLSGSESRRAGWFLWNCVIFHILMDGLSGTKLGNALMTQNYEVLDQRFRPDVADRGDAANAITVVTIELFFHSFVTLLAYIGVVTNSKWRYEAEIVALVTQLLGTFVFVVPEFLTACHNMVRQ